VKAPEIRRPIAWAYYNEFDPGAAAWLRELIRMGEIADGEVDERSILDVGAADLRGFRQCHFFAGIGGWSYALRLAGWPDDRPVWTGSPPCQPFSAAGRQEGRNDARHLAPHFIDLVRTGRPPVLFGEQVASSEVFGKAASGARKRAGGPPDWAWIDDLSDRLEAARYAVGASDFPSAGVGAPHIRQRTFFGAVDLADADDAGLERRREPGRERGTERAAGACGLAGGLADSTRERRDGRQDPTGSRRGAGTETVGPVGGLADADSGERQRIADGEGCQPDGTPTGRIEGDGIAAAGRDVCRMADAERLGRDRRQGLSTGRQHVGQDAGWIKDHDGPVCFGETGDGSHRTSPLNGFWSDADWLFCRDGKWRPVEPGTFPLAHGVSGRVGLLRGYGNAINPHAAKEFIAAFTQAMKETTQ